MRHYPGSLLRGSSALAARFLIHVTHFDDVSRNELASLLILYLQDTLLKASPLSILMSPRVVTACPEGTV